MKKSMIFVIVGILLFCQLQAQAGDKRTRNAALVGGGVGLVAGGVSGAAKGATIAGGVSGAAKGALYGGATGAVVGEHKDKKRK